MVEHRQLRDRFYRSALPGADREHGLARIARRGMIVAEFFDTGESRAPPWTRRPQAATLVAQLADPDSGWDAIVIGEYERAFYGSQYSGRGRVGSH